MLNVIREEVAHVVVVVYSQIEVEKRREEQRKYGVFFDDDYNYLQHLREASQPAELVSAPRPYRETRPLGFEEEEEEEEEVEEVDEDEQGKDEVLTIPVRLVERV